MQLCHVLARSTNVVSLLYHESLFVSVVLLCFEGIRGWFEKEPGWYGRLNVFVCFESKRRLKFSGFAGTIDCKDAIRIGFRSGEVNEVAFGRVIYCVRRV